MHKIGVLFGMEDTFPWALIDRINSMDVPGVRAEMVKLDAVRMAEPTGYRLIIDRISHDINFYRAALKNAVLGGTIVINNPFWWSADDKFFNYALASRLGIAIPHTVVLPHYKHPPGTTAKSMRNLHYPLNWDAVFAYIGFPAFLKPFSGGGWKSVYKVHSPEEFFEAYHDTGDLCMTLQEGIEFTDYYRCYVINRKKVHIMPYDPRRPHEQRYVRDAGPIEAAMRERVTNDCLTICRALGYDLNTVEFAVRGGVPYAIDFLNPAPDADFHSVGQENFEWIVGAVAEMAVERALDGEQPGREFHWSAFLDSGSGAGGRK
jgi:glutathione synthase/RimK-type ligase-like ATP-grasp enzyme